MGLAILSTDYFYSQSKVREWDSPRGRVSVSEGKMDIIRIPISSDSDVVTARMEGRAKAERAGFKGTDLTVVSTVISEMARYITESHLPGELVISVCRENGKIGIVLAARTFLAKKPEELLFAHRLRPLMDECTIYYKPDETVLSMKKWVDVCTEEPGAGPRV